MDEFYEVVSSALLAVGEGNRTRTPCVADALAKFIEHQIVIIIGETGTGKTTQYARLSLIL